ncbi:LysO family transporter [Paraburkholderia megapolitana]|uniref:Uncharacterized membrane protein YbjE, DUF340 family n=1 Tax=Paraburkholderia megapolitana TaxID=420953 RepID=A0A1I3EDC4_9BURK|nr:lysine exporter LysO family protein [Paraburkholderia megapolitana]QDQ80022.1 lysine exporter LysO family protein [Paraburkholderia megapolitana]SFH96879.1 Uncharacterized membrane protein YbjE, DUF340 family [Paraburkholderia megapolitana]
MQTLAMAVLPILLALVAGYITGRFINSRIRNSLIRLITPLVWLLLLSIGYQFGDVLGRATEVTHAVAVALLLATLTTIFPWLFIALAHRLDETTPRFSSPGGGTFNAVLKPLKECTIALLMVATGVLLSFVEIPAHLSNMPLPSTDQLLYALIWLIGVDLVGLSVNSKWLSLRVLSIPVLVILGSLTGGAIASAVGGPSLAVALGLSSGFGWFTLSGVLVAGYLGNTYGTIALLTDLFRELLAIVLLYSPGARFSESCIGASGATALDSTLPIIKQTCRAADIPTALVSGLILTLIAPFLITLFLMK